MIRRLAALVVLLLLGSIESVHAQSRAYPSLSRRPVESRDRDAEIAKAAAEQPAAKPLDAAVMAELGRLGAQAATGGSTFDQDAAACDRAVASAVGTAPSSEAWVTAQQAVSALDASRFDSVTALAGMDSIYVEQLNAGSDLTAIDTYRAPVVAMVDRQNDRLDSLRGRLSSP